MRTETLETLAELDHVVAIKNSTSDSEHFLGVMRTLNGKARIFGVPMTAMEAGLVIKSEADGTTGPEPSWADGFYNALWADDRETAPCKRQDQRTIADWFLPDYTARFGPALAIFKTALNLQGLPGGFPRRRILPLTTPDIAVMRQTFEALVRL